MDPTMIAIAAAVLVVFILLVVFRKKTLSKGDASGAENLVAESSAKSAVLDEDAQKIDDAAVHVPKEPLPAESNKETLREGLRSTKKGFIQKVFSLLGGGTTIDERLLDEVEEVLMMADVGVQTTDQILENIRGQWNKGDIESSTQIWKVIESDIRSIVMGSDKPFLFPEARPAVFLIVGVNGVGKTTTIGKLANHFSKQGKKVVLAAGDTFRAAAVEQLEAWGRRTSCEVIRGAENADPASVIFEAIEHAKAQNADVVLADTAGRLHTKAPLMDELSKVNRTIEKALGRPADEAWLVLDATTGQNAIQQAQTFKEAIPLSGVILTKLDGTAKGGIVLSISQQFSLPIRFIGLGEKVDNLKEFVASDFVEVLLEKEQEEALT